MSSNFSEDVQLDGRPYHLEIEGTEPVWIHDFGLMSESADIDLEIDELQATFEDTVGRLFRGEIERDDFNIKHEYDLFLSHASEDKDGIARPLYEALIAAGISVWFDEAVLELGDSLRRKIDEGLAKCRYGLVILSPKFLSKQWPQRELDGLVARETASGEKAILPIWHELDQVALLRYFPPLVDRLAGRSEEGIPALVEKILRVLKK